MTPATEKKYKLVIDHWFVNGFNGTKAVQKVYPKAKDNTAAVTFNNILRIPKIENYIESKRLKAEKATRMNQENILKELENWVFADRTAFLTLTPEELQDMPIEMRRLITRTKTTTKKWTEEIKGKLIDFSETTIQIWFPSKERAIEMASKHIGFYAEHNHQKVTKLTPEARAKKLEKLKKKLALKKSKE